MKRKLGCFEKANAITNEHFPFNAVIVLRIDNGPSSGTLRKVLKILRHRHPMLGVHLRREKNNYFFESEGTPEIPLEIVKRQNNEQWNQVVEEELNKGIDDSIGPMLRCTYLTDSNGGKEKEIIITFHHAVLDASSGNCLIHEILSLCERIESNLSTDDFKKMRPVPPVEDLFPQSYKGIGRGWRIFLFILRQIVDEFIFRLKTRGARKAPIHSEGRCKILPIKLPEEIGGKLCKKARRERVTLNSLFNAAILLAVNRLIYEGKAIPMRNFNFAILRPYLNPPVENEYLGSYFSMMRFTVKMKANQKVWELAREINTQIYKMVKRGDKFTTNLLSANMMRAIFRFKSFRMAATALSYTGVVKLEKNYGTIIPKDIHAFVSNFVLGPEYTAQARLFNGVFYWDIVYLDSDMDFNRAKVIADEIMAILNTAAKGE